MVMLDMLCRRFPAEEVIVAHFDHGIRRGSGLDAEFVRKKAMEYGVEFRSGRAELGTGASEAEAREKRYEFLMKAATETGGEVWTAHHLDDLVETVTINFLRGTGWRGLAGLDRAGVRRPFLETEMFYEPLDRAGIFEYAAKRRLRFREDPSNSWDEYLRNRVRQNLNNSPLGFEQKLEVWRLWQRQRELRREIDGEVVGLLPEDGRFEREWFRGLSESVALEVLRAATLRAGISATRPQLLDFWQAILTYGTGKSFNLPGDRLVKFGKEGFSL